MAIEIKVTSQGPVFDGRAISAIHEYLAAATGAVADEGVNLVKASGHSDYKHPTGYYESQIVTDQVEPDATAVWDSDVIYGPWLEGLSSRNHSTRFKGYATFRKTTPVLEKRGRPIAYRLLELFVKRMNG